MTGVSDEFPNCMWEMNGAGTGTGPSVGAGLGAGQLTVNISFDDIVAPYYALACGGDYPTATP